MAEAGERLGGAGHAQRPRALRLRVLREGVEDDARQRDALRLARPRPARRRDPAQRPWKTSLVFWGAGDDAPGWLVRCLSEFAFRGVNLTKIESRPRKRGLGHYLFFADLEGRVDDAPVAEAVEACAHCEQVRVLGSYPGRHRLTGPADRYTAPPGMATWGSRHQDPAGSAPLFEHRRRGADGGRVLVLNATYEPINVCTVRRAAVLLLKEKAEVVEHGHVGAALREHGRCRGRSSSGS